MSHRNGPCGLGQPGHGGSAARQEVLFEQGYSGVICRAVGEMYLLSVLTGSFGFGGLVLVSAVGGSEESAGG